MKDQCARYDEEHHKLTRIVNFRLPHHFKKVGLIAAVLIFIFLLGYKFYGDNALLTKDICRTLVLLFLFVASMSKDVIEDEYINYLRFQSYVVAFVCTVAYSVSIPLIGFVLELLITSITGDGRVNFHGVSSFEVMFMLLCFQMLFFETMKRFGRAQ